jgi:hypothetical protein
MRSNLTHLLEVQGSSLIQIQGQKEFGISFRCLGYTLCSFYASLNRFNNTIEMICEIGKVPDNDTDLQIVAVAYDSAGKAIEKSYGTYHTKKPWGSNIFTIGWLKYPDIGLSKICISANLLEAESNFVDPTAE